MPPQFKNKNKAPDDILIMNLSENISVYDDFCEIKFLLLFDYWFLNLFKIKTPPPPKKKKV